MKLHSSKAGRAESRGREAFTMIEMIGVLAVIAILAAMLIPRVFQAVDTARVTSTMVAIETVKTAAIDHYGRQGRLDMKLGAQLVVPNDPNGFTNYDTLVLMPENLLEKPFSSRLAGPDPSNPNGDPTTNCAVQLVQGPVANNSAGFDLDGSANGVAANTATANAQYVLQAVINKCSLADAKELNDRIDGLALGAATPNGNDIKGKVEYQVNTADNTCTVYIYLTHR